MSDVLRLGRVRQVATSELDRVLGRQQAPTQGAIRPPRGGGATGP
jgi:hypothetical protein